MDSGIEFGEIQHKKPDNSLRPDQDPHYSVVPVGDIGEDELPIFVDLDAMREMEGHARTNTKVELGGVMLGFQFHDNDDQPFVLVTDCLRAEHYEATKGSFKFTHDTWQSISRQRDEYPEKIQMVGWYHTHPDWGVFLSGMDLFICNNFFNRPLDIALVIDPCRDDRGWFQWENLEPIQTQRTGGFNLYASRFREQELNYFSNLYDGDIGMPADSRYNPMMNMGGQPIVNINDQRTPIQNISIMSMLTIQMLFLGLIGWKMLAAPDVAKEKEVAEMREALKVIEDRKTNDIRNEAYSEILASMLKEGPHPEDLVEKLVDEKERRSKIAFDFEAYRTLNKKLNDDLSKSVRERKKTNKDLLETKTILKKEMDRYSKLASQKGSFLKTWMLVVGSLALFVLGGLGGFFYNQYANENSQDGDSEKPFTPPPSEQKSEGGVASGTQESNSTESEKDDGISLIDPGQNRGVDNE